AKACEAVSAVFRAGITPSALEFMERDAIDFTLKHMEDIKLDVAPEVQAHLLIEVDGQHDDVLMRECETILGVMEAHGGGEVLFAESASEKDALWYLRRNVAVAVKAHAVYKEEDTVVPRYALPELLAGIKRIGKVYGFRTICYGHAGDGNLHVNILRDALTDAFWEKELPKAIREIFTLTVSLGGTLSGEHGIGLVQRPYMDIAFSPIQLQLMRSIKDLFDPTGILNPGKVLPEMIA
ncbi:MAG TPA: FAD-linked oxidase C-terminal domain-containing protein, partial [Flavobacteriales bacterium]|nr:FAD-linked oxidase C-terminal domain-containing protein [Flavobacteriales bacterium]